MVNDIFLIIEIKDHQIGLLSKKDFTIYETKSFQKINSIKNKSSYEFSNIIELDNNVIVLINNEKSIINDSEKCDYLIEIYRYKNGEYILFQTLEDKKENYSKILDFNFCVPIEKIFIIKNIKKLSDNRFIILSSYGFKIYFYNNLVYSILLKNENNSYLDMNDIYELNKNEMLFFNLINITHSYFLINSNLKLYHFLF